MEGQSTTSPPFFYSNDYSYWKIRMMDFLQALDYEIWKIVCDGSFIPRKNALSELDKNKYDMFLDKIILVKILNWPYI